MRTDVDLQGAFALLEHVADRHYRATGGLATLVPPATEAPAFELAYPRPRSRRGRRSTGLMAAAIAAVLTVVAVAVGRLGTHRDAAPTAGPRFSRTYQVTVAPELRFTAFDVNAQAGFTQVSFTRSSGPSAMVRVLAAGRTPSGDLQPLTVNGHPGYFALGDPFAPTSAQPSPAPGLSSLPVGIPAVVWEYAPGRWAEVVFETGRPTRAELLRVARAVRFTAPRPIRTALRLTTKPAGFTLSAIAAPAPGSGRPRRDFQVRTSLAYSSADGRRTVAISLVPWLSGETADRTTVAGRPAYWQTNHAVAGPSRLELRVDEGAAGMLDVTGLRGHWSRRELRAIAEKVVITPHPDEPDRWYDARTLP